MSPYDECREFYEKGMYEGENEKYVHFNSSDLLRVLRFERWASAPHRQYPFETLRRSQIK